MKTAGLLLLSAAPAAWAQEAPSLHIAVSINAKVIRLDHN
jgi:hypothetical protein